MPPDSSSTRELRRSPRRAISSVRSIAARRSDFGTRYRNEKTSRFCLLRLAGQPVAQHLELALVGDRLRGQHAHRRRLAGAVRAEQADARSLGDDEVEAVDRDDLPVALDHAVQPDCVHGR
jgi:hypothetical protein